MKRQQTGVALITALLVVSLVAIVGAAMLTRMNVAMHRSGNLWLDEQAWWYAYAVEKWVDTLLQLDAEKTKIDSLQEAWAQPVDYLPIEGGAIQGQLVDLQGRFNLNDLVGSNANDAAAQFQRLIGLVTDADVVTARTIVQSTIDWIDTNIQPTLPDGAEDDYYLGLSPAYRAANHIMVTPSTLRSVRGVTAKIYAALAPYITALPDDTPINVNTAPIPVLASLAEGVDLRAAKSLVKKRADTPWDSVQAFLQEDEMAGRKVDPERLSVTTSYFRAAGRVNVARGQVRFYSVFVRGNGGTTHVLRHSRNVY